MKTREINQAINDQNVLALSELLTEVPSISSSVDFAKAVRSGNNEIITMLANKGATVTAPSINYAIEQNGADLLGILLNCTKTLPLSVDFAKAVQLGNNEIITMLANKGAIVSPLNINYAIEQNNLDVLRILLNYTKTLSSSVDFAKAVRLGNNEIITMLADKGAIVSPLNINYAIEQNKADLLGILLNYTKTLSSSVDFAKAVRLGNNEIITMLADKGAIVSPLNINYAIEQNKADLLGILLNYTKTLSSSVDFTKAVMVGNPQILKVLANHDINSKNSLINIATRQKNETVLKILNDEMEVVLDLPPPQNQVYVEEVKIINNTDNIRPIKFNNLTSTSKSINIPNVQVNAVSVGDLENALMNNNSDLFHELVKNSGDISPYQLSRMADLIVAKQNLAALNSLILKGYKAGHDAIKESITKDNFEMYDLLIKNSAYISPYHLSLLANLIIEKQNLDALNTLILKGYKAGYDAIKESVTKDNFKVFDLLIENSGDISPYHLSNIADLIIAKQNLAALNTLISKGYKAGYEAIRESVTKGNFKVFDLLIENSGDISSYQLSNIADLIIAKQNLAALNTLISKGYKASSDAIREAVTKDNFEIIKLLIENGVTLGGYAQSSIVDASVKNINFDVVKYLVSEKGFPLTLSALVKAFDNNEEMFLNSMLSNEVVKQSAILYAVEGNNLDILCKITRNDEKIKTDANLLSRAIVLNNTAMFNYLVEKSGRDILHSKEMMDFLAGDVFICTIEYLHRYDLDSFSLWQDILKPIYNPIVHEPNIIEVIELSDDVVSLLGNDNVIIEDI